MIAICFRRVLRSTLEHYIICVNIQLLINVLNEMFKISNSNEYGMVLTLHGVITVDISIKRD